MPRQGQEREEERSYELVLTSTYIREVFAVGNITTETQNCPEHREQLAVKCSALNEGIYITSPGFREHHQRGRGKSHIRAKR